MKIPDGDTRAARGLEDRLADFFNVTRETLRKRCDECEAFVRRSPTQSLLTAVGIGYILNKLPLVSIGVAIGRLVFALLRPAAILFCVIKIYDSLNRKQEGSAPVTTPAAAPEAAPPF
ncbi:MAG TPA: hypothetical protein VIT91_12585 [Chthoniobacterales bacterium]